MANDRDNTGRFKAGNKARLGTPNPNAGRKPDAAKRELAELIDAAVTDEQWEMLFRVMLSRGCAGDTKAAALALAYKFGRPLERREVSGPNGSDIPIGYRMATSPGE